MLVYQRVVAEMTHDTFFVHVDQRVNVAMKPSSAASRLKLFLCRCMRNHMLSLDIQRLN